MGRRPRGCRPIGRIILRLGDHRQAFELRQESLVDRDESVALARSLHDAAIAYLRDPNGFSFLAMNAPVQVQSSQPDPDMLDSERAESCEETSDQLPSDSAPQSWDGYFGEYARLNW